MKKRKITALLLAAVMAFPAGVSALAASPAEGAQIETAAESVKKTAEYGIYDMGDFDSFNYRIPALAMTKNGVLLAAADQRNTHSGDWGNIDTVVRRSMDKGATWEDPIDIVDLKKQSYDSGTQSAFTIDPALLATESGRVFMLVDLFPESTGFSSIKEMGSGFKEIDGKRYLILKDADGNEYTLRGDRVYDKDGNKTNYMVDSGSGEEAYHTMGDLYKGEEYMGNIYLKSSNAGNDSAPLSPLLTSYLILCYSDDDGKTWSEPVNISGQIKDERSKFCGTGPGVGIELKNGQYEGRLMFPVYYTTDDGFQSSACIYSDDGGKTWTRGESPNDGRINDLKQETNSWEHSRINQLTESQIVELENGHLLQFMRNTDTGKVMMAASTDGGATWEQPATTEAADVYCQLSVIHYPEKVDVDGDGAADEIVLMSNPNGPARTNGTLRIGKVNADDTVTWVKNKIFCPGGYAYSCLSYLGDQTIGLLYEHADTIKFTSFNLEYIQSEGNELAPAITAMEKTEEDGNYLFTVTLDQRVTVKGQPKLRFKIGDVNKYADLVSLSDDGMKLVFRFVPQPGDEGTVSFRGPKIISDADNFVKNAAGLEVSSNNLQVDLGEIGKDRLNDPRNIPVEDYTIQVGSAQKKNDEKGDDDGEHTKDGDPSTLWHTQWSMGHNRADHWISYDFGREHLVDTLYYQPRQDGVNGRVTACKIQASANGTDWEDIAAAIWEADASWKTASFVPTRTRYLRMAVLDAQSSEAANDYASAAEIRIAGAEPAADAEKEAPTQPANAQADAQMTTASITWDASSDNVKVTTYVVIGEDGTMYQTEKNSLALSGLETGRQYTYSIRAYDAAGNYSQAASVRFSTKTDTEKPEAPQVTAEVGQDSTTVLLSWEAAQDNVGVVRYVVRDGQDEIVKVTSATRVTLKELAKKQTYTYSVTAIDAAGNHSDKAEVTFMTLTERDAAQEKLQARYDKYERRLGEEGFKEHYTTESWTAYEKAMDDVKALLGDPEATQEQLDAAYADLAEKHGALMPANKDYQEGKDVYKDVKKADPTHWFYDTVMEAYHQKIMTGKGDGTSFQPNVLINRAEVAIVLHRLSGLEAPKGTPTEFVDTTPERLYETARNAIAWASTAKTDDMESAIVTGFPERNAFDPQNPITRQQMATMLYRYAQYMGYDTSMEKDPDAKADWNDFTQEEKDGLWESCRDAMQWCVAKGIISGDGGRLNGNGQTNRATAATMLVRFAEKFEN